MAAVAICIVCEIDPATAKCATCANCRSNMHYWQKKRPAQILQRAVNLQVYRRRMDQFAVIKDESVQLVPNEILEQNRVMMFPKRVRQSKRNAKAIETAARIRNRRSSKRER